MSKYTAEQVDAVVEQTSGTRKEMLNDYAALLRERESAKAVTDEYSDAFKDVLASLVAAVSLLCRGGRKAAASDKIFRIMADDYEKSIIRGRAALEAVAPMLASARVPDGWQLVPKKMDANMLREFRRVAGAVIGMYAAAMGYIAALAVAPKPEDVWPADAREKAFSLAREMLQKGTEKPEAEV